MVTRLLVGLLCFSFGLVVVAQTQVSTAQDEVPKIQTAADKVQTPVQESSKPIPAKTESDIQEEAKSKTDAAKKDQSEAAKSKTDKSKTDKPETDKPETDKPETDKPETKKADSKKPKSLKQESVNPKTVAMPKSKKTVAVESGNGKLVTTEPAAKAEVKSVSPESETAILSEHLLPASTKFWVSIPDSDELANQFESTQFGLLARDPAIKPFIDSLREQIKDVMNDHNVSLGIKVEDLHGVHSGEICVAGVLPNVDGKQLGKGSHGLIVLFDVSNTRKEALELQVKVNEQLKENGAKIEEKSINGVMITKATLKQQKPIRNSQSNFQAIVNDWMLISDNELIFRDVLRRLSAPDQIQKAETLASVPCFQAIMEKTEFKDYDSQIRWFIDPFGYIKLAQSLEDEKRGDLQPRDDWSKVLREQGFEAFKGVGGNIAISTGDHEVLHQTFTYAPRDQKIKNLKQVFEMFNFTGNSLPLEPASWVPDDSSAYIVGNWEFSDALGTVGALYDGFLDEEGAFDRTLNDFKVDPDMQLDVKKLVGLLNNRVTVVSAVERPIDETSERVVIGIPLKGEPDFVFDSLVRATGGQVIKLGRFDVIEVDSAAMDIGSEEDEFSLPGELEIQEEEPEKPAFQLFAKRYFVVHGGNLLVANNKNYLRKLLAQKKSNLGEAHDYVQIKEAIDKLTKEENICWRQFGRMDRTLETNYEMLRRGEMGKSQTVLARVINQVFAKQAAEKAAAEGKKVDEEVVRTQKLDGSKLPADYAKSVAPYFGPMGWVVETEENGWRITGCLTKKKEMTEVVQKTTDEKKDSQQR